MSPFIAAVLACIASAPAAAQSVQQQFDAATALSAAGKWPDSLQAWEALEARLAKSTTSRSLAIVRVRKAEALVKLGRYEDAETALRRGLPGLPASDPTIAEDRFIGLVGLGGIAERDLDYGEALQQYQAASQAAPDSFSRLRALSGMVRTGMFFDASAALHNADEALRLAQEDGPERSKKNIGQTRTLRARVLLNLGRFEEARTELKAATAELGGLTMRVDAADVVTRSDNAIASLLAGKEDEARKYLAYAGAGRLPKAFDLGAEMKPPACGGVDGLLPEDVAVVEFTVLDDGSVGWAAPIYSSRQGDSALAFARAARGWSWTPEQAKAIPAFFRYMTRVELRCTATSKRPSAAELLTSDVIDWLRGHGVAPLSATGESDARRAPLLLDELRRRNVASGGRSPAVVPVLLELAANVTLPAEDRVGFVARALEIAREQKAPGRVVAAIGLRSAGYSTKERSKGRDKDFEALLLDPAVAADPTATATVRLGFADLLYLALNQKAAAIEQLARIRDSAGLSPQDPIRTAALIRMSSIEFATGDIEAARAAFTESGLKAEQCALLDTGPRLKRIKASYTDFPMEAMRWGFEGWVKTEYDVRANGTVAAPRPVVTYPPFVFAKAAMEVISRTTYEPSFRPDDSLGCGGMNQTVRFVMP
jgi:tetratricopeptide (TPR) repeat protein